MLKVVLSAAALVMLASAHAQTGGGDKAPPEFHQGPAATTAHPKKMMRAGHRWIAERLQDKTFAARHHIPYSRVDMSRADGPNQVGVGIELAGAERFVNFGELNWRRHPSGHYAAVIAYTAEQAAALRIALNLKGFPERLTVKFVSADATRPYPEASLDHAAASGYLNRGVSVHWSPVHFGDTAYIELNHPDINEAGFDAGRIELPAVSYIFAGGPWGVKTQPAPAADKGFVTAKARVDRGCTADVSCSIAGISDTARENFSRATGLLMFTDDEGESNYCTGHLIADNDAATARPYMLTANHCIDTSSEAASVAVFWGYRSASCGGDVEPESSPQTMGSELLATASAQDWTFLILGSDSAPARLPGARYFLGWDSAAPVVGETLHHIGHSAVNPQSYARGTVSQLNVPRSNGKMRIIWQDGHTAGGASGSVFVRISGDNLYARSGGLSEGTEGECLALTPSITRRYGARDSLAPFSLVYQNQIVRNRLGSGRQRTEGAGTVGDVVVTLASSAEVLEGDAGTRSLVFNLMRSGTTAQALPFRWESLTGGSATSGVDYTGVSSGSGRFPAGGATAALSVTVRGDTRIEPDEMIGVRVSDNDGNILANNLVGIIRDDDDDHGNVREYATRLGVSNAVNTVNARIEHGTDIDYFLVMVPQGSGDILTAYTSGSLDTIGALEDGGGVQLTFHDDIARGRDANLNFRLAYRVFPGNHYIWLRSYEAGDTGGYSLNVSLSDATVLDLSSGSAEITGAITSGNEVDYFRFNIPVNFGETRITAYTSGSLDTIGALEDSSGNQLVTNDDGGFSTNFRIEHNVAPGDYYIQIASFGNLTGNYRLHVEAEALLVPPPVLPPVPPPVPPSVTVPGDGSIGISEDGELAPTAVATADPVEAGQTITSVSVASSVVMTVNAGGSSIGDFLSSASFSLAGDGETVLFAATPRADRFGVAVFTVAVTDSGGESSTFEFTLRVKAVNDPPVITVAESSSPLELVGGERRGVVAGLSDVDVSAADSNLNRFAQAGDTLALRLPEGAADVALRLRDGLADEGGRVFLDGSAAATVQGDGGAQTTLTFTAGLTAAQVEELMEAVEVSATATATAGRYELSIALTTNFNDGVGRREEDREPLAGVAAAPVEVDRRTMLTVSFDRAGTAVVAGRRRTVGLSVSPVLINGEEVTVTLDVESGPGSTAVTVLPSEVIFNRDWSATEVTVRVADGIERGTTARVTIDATATGGSVPASAGDSLLVRVVSGILLRIRAFLEGALQ